MRMDENDSFFKLKEQLEDAQKLMGRMEQYIVEARGVLQSCIRRQSEFQYAYLGDMIQETAKTSERLTDKLRRLTLEIVVNPKEYEKYKEDLEREREKYLEAEDADDDPEAPEFQKENENGIRLLPKYRIKDKSTGEILQEFQSPQEKALFMDCIKNGEIVFSQNERLPCNVRCMLDEFAISAVW